MIGMGTGLSVLGAAIALGIPGIASAFGVGIAGITGVAAVAENKENFKNALVLQAMPQTQVIYGFITALFILMGAGILGAAKEVSTAYGLVSLAAGLIVGLTGVSSTPQGMVSGAGIAACAKNNEAFVPSLIFSGQCETPAIFGFVSGLIVLVVGIGVLG